jgi:hypothetical protein
MKVAILGCGPAGLFAAHAAVQAGHLVTIFSKPRKSYMRGAQYLHRPIPGLSGEPFKVDYELWGTVEGYRSKVYGDMSDILVSPESLVGRADAWDIREAYDAAWELYGDGINDWDATAPGAWQEIADLERGTVVISTIPATLLCHNLDHCFTSQKVWATEGLKRPHEMGFDGNSRDGVEYSRDNLVVCSGDPDDWWYRQSRIHGWENTEFPYDKKPNTTKVAVHEVTKPIATDCDCFPTIHRMGRYGAWKKGVLSDAAYYDTKELLK